MRLRKLLSLPLLLCGAYRLGGQEPAGEAQRPTPTEIRISSLSGWFGGYSLAFPQATNMPSTLMTMGGAGADLTWNATGPRLQALLTYHGDYTRNLRFSELNGFDHAFSFSLRARTDRRTNFGLDVMGQSNLLANATFMPGHTLSAAQQSADPAGLEAAMSDQLSTDLSSSPLTLLLSGGRHYMGGMHMRITHSYSPRLQFQARVGAVHDQHSTRDTPANAVLYPSTTMGVAEGGLTYSVSRRTRIIAGIDYWKSYSRDYRFDVESASAGWERSVGRRSFCRIEGGYARTAFLGANRAARNGYTASGALGTISGHHTLVASFHRGVADLHGLRADSMIGADGAWSWSAPASPWILTATAGYERLGGSLGTLNTWLFQSTIAHLLTRTLRLQLESAYVNSSTLNISDFSRGVRLALVWMPGAPPPRAQ
jgi:hypothetical protein